MWRIDPIMRRLDRIEGLLRQVLRQEELQVAAIDDLVSVTAAAVDALQKLEAIVQSPANTDLDPRIAQAVSDLRAAVDIAATIDGDAPPTEVTPPSSGL